MEQGLEFDDILLKPKHSNVNSRGDVDISVDFEKFKLEFPVIASPMRGIVNADFCVKFAELGGIGVLHRFYDDTFEWDVEVEKISEAKLFGLSVGLHDNRYLKLLQHKPNILLVDVANGNTQAYIDFCKQVRKDIDKISPETLLMAGNVATFCCAQDLKDVGAEWVRVGIGGGGLCTTRNITGVGVPQVTALLDCSQSTAKLVSDGGIKDSGDAVKAFACGADVVMLGSLLAQTFESPADSTIYGMASRKLQDMRQTQAKSVEGIEKIIEKTMPLKQFVEEFSWGIRSAGTYLSANNLQGIYDNAEIILVGRGSIKDLG